MSHVLEVKSQCIRRRLPVNKNVGDGVEILPAIQGGLTAWMLTWGPSMFIDGMRFAPSQHHNAWSYTG
jgi:hypothetical protein